MASQRIKTTAAKTSAPINKCRTTSGCTAAPLNQPFAYDKGIQNRKEK